MYSTVWAFKKKSLFNPLYLPHSKTYFHIQKKYFQFTKYITWIKEKQELLQQEVVVVNWREITFAKKRQFAEKYEWPIDF